MRQLQALDQSLQRVTRANGDIRRADEWIPPNPNNAQDDEVLLVHTFINSQPAPEEVVIAAQSSARLPREPAGGITHAHPIGSVHWAERPVMIDGVLQQPNGIQRPLSSKRLGVTWIDDPKRTGTTHTDVPVSPTTKRPIPERPPTSSYSSLALGPGWVDTSGHAVPFRNSTNSTNSTNSSNSTNNTTNEVTMVVPSASGKISLAASSQPSNTSPSKMRSILRGSSTWFEQYHTVGNGPTNTSGKTTNNLRPASATTVGNESKYDSVTPTSRSSTAFEDSRFSSKGSLHTGDSKPLPPSDASSRRSSDTPLLNNGGDGTPRSSSSTGGGLLNGIPLSSNPNNSTLPMRGIVPLTSTTSSFKQYPNASNNSSSMTNNDNNNNNNSNNSSSYLRSSSAPLTRVSSADTLARQALSESKTGENSMNGNGTGTIFGQTKIGTGNNGTFTASSNVFAPGIARGGGASSGIGSYPPNLQHQTINRTLSASNDNTAYTANRPNSAQAKNVLSMPNSGNGPVRALVQIPTNNGNPQGSTVRVPNMTTANPRDLADQVAALNRGGMGRLYDPNNGTISRNPAEMNLAWNGDSANPNGSFIPNNNGGNSAAAILTNRTGGGVQIPVRTASSRVRGYSPGPGRIRERNVEKSQRAEEATRLAAAALGARHQQTIATYSNNTNPGSRPSSGNRNNTPTNLANTNGNNEIARQSSAGSQRLSASMTNGSSNNNNINTSNYASNGLSATANMNNGYGTGNRPYSADVQQQQQQQLLQQQQQQQYLMQQQQYLGGGPGNRSMSATNVYSVTQPRAITNNNNNNSFSLNTNNIIKPGTPQGRNRPLSADPRTEQTTQALSSYSNTASSNYGGGSSFTSTMTNNNYGILNSNGMNSSSMGRPASAEPQQQQSFGTLTYSMNNNNGNVNGNTNSLNFRNLPNSPSLPSSSNILNTSTANNSNGNGSKLPQIFPGGRNTATPTNSYSNTRGGGR